MMQVHEMIRGNYPEYYSIERYPADRCVCVRTTKEEWGVLGNFYMTPIEAGGVTFDCTERLYHMMKLKADAQEGVRDMMNTRAGMGMKMHLKHLYKVHPEWLHDHWPSMIVDAMKFCLTLKYEQCELFRKELERSRGMFIVEAFLVVVGQSCRYQYLGQMVTFVKYSFAYLFNHSHKFNYRQQRAAFKGYIVDEVH